MRYKTFSNTRLKLISFLFLVVAILLVVKLFGLQILNAEYYQNEADRQYATPSKNIYERGSIYFKRIDGTLVTAGSQVSGFKVSINNTKVNNKFYTFDELNKVIDIDEEEYYKKVADEEDTYEEIAHHLSKEEADEVSALGLPGITVFKEKWRFYPVNEMAAHTVGFVGYNGDTLEGRYGLERQYDDTLRRSDDDPHINVFAEIFSDIGDVFGEEKRKNGDLVTTIEPAVQLFLEKTLSSTKERYEIDSVGGIVINPTTGAIYAMSAQPNFNPNTFREEESVLIFSNPLVENVFEFGSVVKPLVMAAAIDAGVVTAETKYNDKGSIVVENKEIFNFDKKGRGPGTTMQDVLNQSLNTGMVEVYNKLGKEKMRRYMYSYGIKEKTGIDLPNETKGLTSNLESPRDLEYANASFGQGVALTPVGMVRALSALANDGRLVTPHVVSEIKYKDGTSETLKYEEGQSEISEATSEEITRMLVVALDKSLETLGKKTGNHSVAAKTGTAQVANPEDGGYYEDRNMHSFFGYFPAYDPQFLIFLYGVHPKGTRFASITWTDPFLDMTKFLLNYYEVPPDR
jgi:stage V sporulation protein D (sporulation-specific penicillin-binding protein)